MHEKIENLWFKFLEIFLDLISDKLDRIKVIVPLYLVSERQRSNR